MNLNFPVKVEDAVVGDRRFFEIRGLFERSVEALVMAGADLLNSPSAFFRPASRFPLSNANTSQSQLCDTHPSKTNTLI